MNYKIEDVQKSILTAAKEVKRICDNNKIDYSLAYGTLIGAVRHEGFIPWDDDIDFAMTRDNYDRFIKCCEEQLGDDFEMLDWHKDNYYGNGFLKILIKDTVAIEKEAKDAKYPKKLFVDVFPMDCSPDSAIRQFIHWKVSRSAIRILQQKNRKRLKMAGIKTPVFLIFRVLAKILSHDFLVKIAEKEMTRYTNSNTDFLVDVAGGSNYKRARVKKHVFSKYVELSFEGEKFKVIEEYDKYLTQEYGDYMKIPPVEERTNHEFLFVDFGESSR